MSRSQTVPPGATLRVPRAGLWHQGVQASAEVCPRCPEAAPPAQTSGILASGSFLAGVGGEVQRVMRGEGGVC